MQKEEFEKMTVENKFSVINAHQNLLTNAISNRMQLLPIIAGLSATLLVIASFNDKLIPLNNMVKIVLSILLVIIPLSLFFYNIDLKRAQIKNKEYIDNLLGTEEKQIKSGFLNKIIAYAPDFIIYILSIVSIIIIFEIWI